jgi:hypothetical protein
MPAQAALPASIAFLSTIDAAPLRVDPDYPIDTQRIIEKILKLAPHLTPRFDPAAALTQAKSGAVPPGWRVWRPTVTSTLGTAWRYFIYTGIITVSIGFLITGLTVGQNLSPNASFAGFGAALAAGLVIGVIAGVIGQFVGSANSGTGYLVLTPDGTPRRLRRATTASTSRRSRASRPAPGWAASTWAPSWCSPPG